MSGKKISHENHDTGRPAKEVLHIKSIGDALNAVRTYGDSPSMLYNMDKKTRSEYAQALIDECVEAGIEEARLPPLWTGIVNDPDTHEDFAIAYRNT